LIDRLLSCDGDGRVELALRGIHSNQHGSLSVLRGESWKSNGISLEKYRPITGLIWTFLFS